MSLTPAQKKGIQIITTNTNVAYRNRLAASDTYALAELNRVAPQQIAAMNKQLATMKQTIFNMQTVAANIKTLQQAIAPAPAPATTEPTPAPATTPVS